MDPRLVTLAAAVRATTAVRTVATALGEVGIRMMVLRGPPVQLRLLGSDSAYRSADVDVLVAAPHRRRAFEILEADGWDFRPDNGVLWRLDRAAAFTKDTVTLDLHWGLHAHTVSARQLRNLEQALWTGARKADDAWYEPQVEPLLVYLAVHGAASAFHKPESLTLVAAAAGQVEDWSRVDRAAEAAHVSSTVRYAVSVARGEAGTASAPPLFDGRLRQLRSLVGRRLRAELSRAPLRTGLRAWRSRRHRTVRLGRS